MRQQGQRTRLAFRLPDQQIDQPRFEQEAVLTSWSLDRGAQVLLPEGTQQIQAPLDELGELRVLRERAEMIRSYGDDYGSAAGMSSEGREEPRPLVLALAQRDGFLALVHDE